MYNDVLQSVNIDIVKVPSFEDVRNMNPIKPEAPHELLEVNLMRVKDLSTLIKLV